MSDLNETFFISVGCMDGRIQNPIAEYGKNSFSAEYPDTITEAELVGLLSKNPSQELLQSIKKKVLISIEKHHSKGIIAHGHQECARNPVDDQAHRRDVVRASELVKQMVPSLEVKPVFVVKENGNWEVEEL